MGARGMGGPGLERARRLMELLSALDSDGRTRNLLALHGGMAMNAFMFDLPRLSVDVDLSLVGEVPPSDLAGTRSRVVGLVRSVGSSLGYVPSYGKDGHAGRTVRLSYEGGQIKADVNFMNRVTPFHTVRMPSRLDASMSFPLLSPYDVLGGKVRAVLGRERVRDLFDVLTISARHGELGLDEGLLHSALLLYASLSDRFPQSFHDSFADGLGERFALTDEDVAVGLSAALSPDQPIPSAGDLLGGTHDFLMEWVDPRDETELAYLDEMRSGRYRPELILPAQFVPGARAFPEARWKERNLRRYAELPGSQAATDVMAATHKAVERMRRGDGPHRDAHRQRHV